jgi:hypothetical protein
MHLSAEERVMMLRRLILALCALLLPLAAQAQSSAPAPAIAGSWDLKLDDTTVFRFEIEQAADGEWQGRWIRPENFNSDGNAFYNIRGGVKNTASMTGLEVGDAVELAFDDPRPGAIPDIFRFRLTGPDSAEMTYVGTPLAPYALVRAGAGTRVGPWDVERIYSRIVARAPDDGELESVTPRIDFDLAGRPLGPAAEPEAEPASEPEPEPEPTRETPRIEADFLEGF